METPQIDPARLPELYEAVCQLHASLELNEVIDRTLRAAIKLAGAERAFIQFPDRYSPYALPPLESAVERSSRTAFETLVNEIELRQRSTLVANTQNDLRFAAKPLAALFTSRTALIVPLQMPDRFIGILIVDRAISSGTFSADDVAMLEPFVKPAAAAIYTTRLLLSNAQFVSEVTHEFMQPVRSIGGFTELLLKEMAGPLTEMQRQFLEIILFQDERMRTLLLQILEANRVETRRLQLDVKQVDLRACIEDVINDHQQAIRDKHLDLTAQVENILPIDADLKRLAQVLAILLDNAILYTSVNGKIEVLAKVRKTHLQVSVKDNGVGITQYDQVHIFSRFYRGEAALGGKHAGTGLSLYTAKNLIELMGGAIGFESEPGQGSTFWFTLPIAEQEA